MIKFGFERLCNDLNESVYPSRFFNQPLYRSCYANKVRSERWYQKKGCFRTMGPPRGRYERPDEFLRKHSRLPPVYFEPNILRDPYAWVNPEGVIRCRRPTSEERREKLGITKTPETLPRIERNFLTENVVKAIRMPAKRIAKCLDECGNVVNTSEEGPFSQRPGFGKVPDYIVQRKCEIYYEKLNLLREIQLAGIPPGMRLIPEDERQDLIYGLKLRWQELTDEFLKLPNHPSEWVIEKKTNLEKQLTDIEYDIRLLYSNQQIMVPISCNDDDDDSNELSQQSHYL